MTWTYSNYMTLATPALRLARARLFHQELTDAITADVAGGGKSKMNSPLTTMLSMVESNIAKLEAQAGEDHAGPHIVHADFRGGTE